MRRFVVLFLVAAACSNAATPATVAPTVRVPESVVASSLVTTMAPPSVPLTPVTTTPSASAPLATTITTTPPPSPATTVSARGGWFVVWVTGRLPDGFAAGLRDVAGVNVVSEVWVGNAAVIETKNAAGEVIDRTRPGFVIPVELHGIDPAGHAPFVPADLANALRGLAADEILLGASSARLRGLGPGATVTLEDGMILTVAGIAADEWVGFAEMVTTRQDPVSLGADRPRYAVVRFDGSREGLEAAATAFTDSPVRVWAEGEVPVFRHADAVQPQIRIKERFGEFSYRPRGGQRVEIDPDWVDANIVTVNLPLIGAINCHRDFAAMLAEVMTALETDGNGHIVTPASDSGCWNPRFIAGRRDLSRHAWGVAADINWGNAFDSTRSPVAPPLVAAMAVAGITSGHDWINPDAGHFEWVGEG